jgi:hypothetical protein
MRTSYNDLHSFDDLGGMRALIFHALRFCIGEEVEGGAFAD